MKGYSGIFRLGEATSTWDADSPVFICFLEVITLQINLDHESYFTPTKVSSNNQQHKLRWQDEIFRAKVNMNKVYTLTLVDVTQTGSVCYPRLRLTYDVGFCHVSGYSTRAMGAYQG